MTWSKANLPVGGKPEPAEGGDPRGCVAGGPGTNKPGDHCECSLGWRPSCHPQAFSDAALKRYRLLLIIRPEVPWSPATLDLQTRLIHLDLKGLEKDKAHPGCLVPWTEASQSTPPSSLRASRAGLAGISMAPSGRQTRPLLPRVPSGPPAHRQPRVSWAFLRLGGGRETRGFLSQKQPSACQPGIQWPLATLSLGFRLRSGPHGPRSLPGRVLSPHCFPDCSPLTSRGHSKPLSCVWSQFMPTPTHPSLALRPNYCRGFP